jgi:hypothetical protein
VDEFKNLGSIGLELPSPAYLFGAILFGIIGFVLYRYGKRAANTASIWVGVLLMLYPYFISGTWELYAVGSGLCLSLYIFRR